MTGRLVSVDILRGIALLGIIANHIFYFSTPIAAQVWQDYHAVAFVFLSGLVFTYRATDSRVPNIVRAVACIVLSLALGAGNPGIDIILINFGILFLLGEFVGKGWEPRRLLIVGASIAVVGPVLSLLARQQIGENTTFPNPGFQHIFTDPGMVLLRPLLYGHYPILQWSAVFFLGMALGKWVLNHGIPDRRVLLRTLAMALGVGLMAKAVSITNAVLAQHLSLQEALRAQFTLGSGNVVVEWSHWADSFAYSGTTLGLLCSLSIVVASLVAIELSGAKVQNSIPAQTVSSVGQATLSVYALHVFIFLIFSGYDFPWDIGYYVATILLLSAVVLLWQKHAPNRGPLEFVISSVVKTEQEKRKSVSQ